MELSGSHTRRSGTPELKRRSVSPALRQKEIGALEIAAEQVMKILAIFDRFYPKVIQHFIEI